MLTFTFVHCVEPVSYQFEPSLRHQNKDIENQRPETGAQNRPDIAQNRENRVTETRHPLANSRECRTKFCKPDMAQRDGAGWLPFLDTYRTMCRAPETSLSANFGGCAGITLRRLAMTACVRCGRAARADVSVPPGPISEVNLFRDGKRVIDLNAEISDGALNLRVAEQ